MPSIIVSSLARRSGEEPSEETMPTYVASQVDALDEPRIFYWWALLVGFLILFTTQLVVFELLVRNFVDAMYGSSERFRRAIGGDPRRIYYPFMILLLVVISVIIFQALSTELLQWAANMSNLAALIMPFALMFLISKLPRPARASWWSYVILVLVAIYFGFFFLNFLVSKFSDSDLSFW
jgi:hypothetical protein